MEFIDWDSLQKRTSAIKHNFNNSEGFRYVLIDAFFKDREAEKILNKFPSVTEGSWDKTTYIDQKKKYVITNFETGSIFIQIFQELNSKEFVYRLGQLCGSENLLPDETLFGTGLHQSAKGAHLNVHVDYNIHPATKLHKRFNVLVYMHKD